MSHWHEDLEFILILSGTMTYNINGRLVELTKGNGIIVNSRQLHYGFSQTRKECEFICILLSPSLLQANDWFYHTYIEPFLTHSAYPFIYLDAAIDWMKQILEVLDKLSCYTTLRCPSADGAQKKKQLILKSYAISFLSLKPYIKI